MAKNTEELAAMLNLGPKSATWLVMVGIKTRADLEALGAVGAYVKVKRGFPKASLNLLWALAGALEGCHYAKLPDGMRESLLNDYEARMALLPPLRR